MIDGLGLDDGKGRSVHERLHVSVGRPVAGEGRCRRIDTGGMYLERVVVP